MVLQVTLLTHTLISSHDHILYHNLQNLHILLNVILWEILFDISIAWFSSWSHCWSLSRCMRLGLCMSYDLLRCFWEFCLFKDILSCIISRGIMHICTFIKWRDVVTVDLDVSWGFRWIGMIQILDIESWLRISYALLNHLFREVLFHFEISRVVHLIWRREFYFAFLFRWVLIIHVY